MSHSIIINGAPGGGFQPRQSYERRSIHDLAKDEMQFSLYAQAIKEMMEAPATNMLSWYQIAGIHGWPANSPWDNVEKKGTNPGRTPYGYCSHSLPTFPTWHRPYLALFEQSLVTFAVGIAGRYNGADAAAWREAALALRAPYWDWAVHKFPPAEVIEHQSLTVTVPNGKLTLDPNPLLSYHYKSDDPRTGDNRPLTVRCPTRNNPNKTDLKALKTSLELLENPDDLMRDRVWSTLTNADTWEQFSNDGAERMLSRFYNSLESIHNTIHGLVAGQMGTKVLSAFDPIFWLHHVNVDRIFSLWQALHPNVWISKGTGTQSLHSGSNLLPFWSGETTFFNSDDSRQWERFGYTYPEFSKIPTGTDPKAAITAEVERLYHSEGAMAMASEPVGAEEVAEEAASAPPTNSTNILASGGQALAQFAMSAVTGHGQSNDTVRHDNPKSDHLDWFIRIRYPVGALDQSWSALFFFGEPPASEHDWRSAENLVGLHVFFENSSPEDCDNCMNSRASGVMTEGVVDLTSAIRRRNLYKQKEEEVDQYLGGNLTWRFQKLDATVIDADKIPGLEISVMTVALEYSEEYHSWRKPAEVRPNHRGLLRDRPGVRQQS